MKFMSIKKYFFENVTKSQNPLGKSIIIKSTKNINGGHNKCVTIVNFIFVKNAVTL